MQRLFNGPWRSSQRFVSTADGHMTEGHVTECKMVAGQTMTKHRVVVTCQLMPAHRQIVCTSCLL